jgi:hypothetical protein
MPVQVGSDAIFPTASVRNLGIHLDSGVSIKTQITKKTVSSCLALLRQIRSVRRSVTRPVLLSLVISLALSHLDYGNATLAGLLQQSLSMLQSGLNVTARLVYATRKYEHVTPLLRDLHWLRIAKHIDLKRSFLCFRCLHGSAFIPHR